VPRKLDTQMPEAANALHGDQISTAQAGVAKSVVGGDTCAEERGGIYGTELIRDGSDAACFSDHRFRISSVYGHSQYHGVLAIHTVSASARFAHPVFATDQADTDPLTDFPPGHACTQRFNAANDFMARNARQSQARVNAHDRGGVGVTDPTCLYADSNLAGTRFGNCSLDNAKTAWR
jgi:hypothetical protein